MLLWGWKEKRWKKHCASPQLGPKRTGLERDRPGLKFELRFLLFDLAELQFPHLQSGHEATYLGEELKGRVSQMPAGVCITRRCWINVPALLLNIWTASVSLLQQPFDGCRIQRHSAFLNSDHFTQFNKPDTGSVALPLWTQSSPQASDGGTISLILQMKTLRHKV